jgi:hypothetical protein
MRPHLDWLYETGDRFKRASADRNDRDARFALALAAKQARRLRRQIKERLG